MTVYLCMFCYINKSVFLVIEHDLETLDKMGVRATYRLKKSIVAFQSSL